MSDSGGQKKPEKRIAKWYFGGIASACAAAFTHPLDLLKVQMQTQKGKGVSIGAVALNVIKQQVSRPANTNEDIEKVSKSLIVFNQMCFAGVLGLYNGISASLLRQLSYSTTRFGVYEVLKQNLIESNPQYKNGIPFLWTVAMASCSGGLGGFIGSPADLVNVRMQNDIKLPPDQRRNYQNAFHGLLSVARAEGVSGLWAGATFNCVRAVLMNTGQLAFYDLTKAQLLKLGFKDGVSTHTSSSLMAGAIATALTQPVDVLKTRLMNAKPGEYSGISGVIFATVKEGPFAFYKGFFPAFTRLAPQTILTFIFMEQLRLRFGTIVH